MKITIKRVATLVMAILLAVGCLGVFNQLKPVSAGVSNQPIVSDGDYTDVLPQNVWNTSYGNGVTATNSVITFANTSANRRITLVKSVKNQTLKSVSFTMQATFNISELPSGARFGLGFGLKNVLSQMQVKGSKFLCFEENGSDLKLSLYSFDASSGAETNLFDSGALVLAKNTAITVQFTVGTDDSVSCDVNGSVFNLPADSVNGEGYLGFGQNNVAGVTASISELSVKAYSNTTPKNTNVYENFNNNAFNSRTINTYAPLGAFTNSYLEVRDGKLQFSNVPKNAMMSTVFEYSNFALGFTLCDLQRSPEYGANDELAKPVSCGFALALGCLSKNVKKTSVELMLEVNPFGGTPTTPAKYTEIVVRSNNVIQKRVVISNEYNIWSMDNDGKDYDFLIYMTDGKLTVSIKETVETGYTQIFAYDHGATPVGFMQISSVDGLTARQSAGVDLNKVWQGNFSLDNISIRNRDEGARLTLVDYANNKTPIPSDYEYEDTWDDDDLLQDELG